MVPTAVPPTDTRSAPPLPRRTGLAWVGAVCTAVGAVVIAVVMAGCAGLAGPRTVTVSEAELRALVQRAFPVQHRVGDLVEMQLAAPELRLLPERDRLALALELSGRERLLGRGLQAQLAFDAGLRWEPGDGTLRLARVQVGRLVLRARGPGGAPVSAEASITGSSNPLFDRVAAAVAERLIEGLVVYRLPAERRAQLDRAGLTPGHVAVTPRGVDITLVPAAAPP